MGVRDSGPGTARSLECPPALTGRIRHFEKSIAECYRIIALDDPRDSRRDELKCISLRACKGPKPEHRP